MERAAGSAVLATRNFSQSARNISRPAGVIAAPRSNKRGKVMKMLVSGFALALALAFTGPAFAQDAAAATDKASCDKAGGTWDDAAKKCTPKM
jgi:hypothetical protein